MHLSAHEVESPLMQGMAVYHVVRDEAAERHVATLSLLNGVSCFVLAGTAGWFLWGIRASVDQDEANVRLACGLAAVGLCLLNAVLALGLKRYAPFARVVQSLAAVACLPLLPLGTIWGLYALWTLWHRDGRILFTKAAAARRRELAHRPAPPYYGAIMPVVAVSVALLSFGVLKSRQVWLASKVQWAAAHEASQRAAVDRSMQKLRDLSVDDLAEERLRADRKKLRDARSGNELQSN